MKNYKKIIASVLVIAIVASCAVGATLAWLQDKTDAVTNTFTTSNVDIDLTETTTDYKMVPGATIAKDPTVTVVKGSEACWVFVKVEETADFDKYITYTIADGWTELEGVEGVYYKEVDAATAKAGVVYSVLKDDQVTVNRDVTNADMTAANANAPELTFTAYAVQKENVASASAAWEIAKTL